MGFRSGRGEWPLRPNINHPDSIFFLGPSVAITVVSCDGSRAGKFGAFSESTRTASEVHRVFGEVRRCNAHELLSSLAGDEWTAALDVRVGIHQSPSALSKDLVVWKSCPAFGFRPPPYRPTVRLDPILAAVLRAPARHRPTKRVEVIASLAVGPPFIRLHTWTPSSCCLASPNGRHLNSVQGWAMLSPD